MTPQGLTKEQCVLLQRFYDEELTAAESVQAEQLLERSAAARIFVQALAELSAAVRAGHELLWERAKPRIPSAGQWAKMAEIAAKAGEMLSAPLDELSGLLDRFHDGEADEAEAAWVRALLQERDDAAAYLAGLDQIAEDLRAAGDQMVRDVDFGGFWDKISAGIDAEAKAVGPKTGEKTGEKIVEFNAAEHLMLLHRFADGETDAAESARVEGWREQDHAEVGAYLAALDEIKFGVTVAAETACEQAPLQDIWTGVARAIDAPASGENAASGAPVSLEDARRKRGGWVRDYRQAIFGAAAAAVVLFGVVGLFQEQIFGPKERVIVEKTIEKRVVIVETVEYSPGSSVMIDSPMTRVNMKADNPKKINPTVIWLFESDGSNSPPSEDSLGAGEPGELEDTSANPDAGQDDAHDFEISPRGQPI